MNKHLTGRYVAGLLLIFIWSTGFSQPLKNNGEDNLLNITTFSVYAKAKQLCIDWATDGKKETNVFEVQQSSDGQNFSTVALVLGADPKKPGDTYACTYINKKLKKNKKYYFRLRHLNLEGFEQISDTKELEVLDNNNSCLRN